MKNACGPLVAALLAAALPACRVASSAVARDGVAGHFVPEFDAQDSLAVRGFVSFAPDAPQAPGYRLQATVGEVANAATVSLIDAKTGNTVASSVSDARGAFTLTFRDFVPLSGAPYTLEAVKGLSLGGKPNRPGAAAVRVRTLLFWNGGWQSLTNTTAGVGITISPATTAVATAISLKKSAGQNLDLATLVGKVSGSSFDESGTGLSRAADFAPVLALVQSALAQDQDPVASIAYDAAGRAYRLAVGGIAVTGVEPAIAVPGGSVTVRGTGFDPDPNRSRYWFGMYPSATWSVAADRSRVTVDVPSQAYSAPLTLERPGGVVVTLDPFLEIKGTVGTLAGNGIQGFADGPGRMAMFDRPTGLAVDPAGMLFVGDSNNHRVRRIAPDGTVSTHAGSSVAGFRDGGGGVAQFVYPYGMCLDAGGSLYLVDDGNHRIRKISPDGQVSTLAGNGAPGFAEGPGSAAQFNNPIAVVADAQGNIYVADDNNERIRKITPDGIVSTLAGSETGFADGAGSAAQFYRPWGIAMDQAGQLFVADWLNFAVRRISTGGVVSTLAGRSPCCGGGAGYVDATGSAARFERLFAVAIDAAGNALVTDNGNRRIRKISPAGVVTTVAGNGLADAVDGPVGNASFNDPRGIAVDQAGNIYVADSANHRIRVITP